MLRLLSSRAVAKVGKDLEADWKLLRAALRSVRHPPTSAEQCGWHELADFTVSHRRKCSLDALTRAFLGRSYVLKGSVDHDRWADWPLSDAQLAYAAGDVCAVIEVLQAASDASVATILQYK